MLPEPKPSSYVYGYSDASFFGKEIPISGAAGDQQQHYLVKHVLIQVKLRIHMEQDVLC